MRISTYMTMDVYIFTVKSDIVLQMPSTCPSFNIHAWHGFLYLQINIFFTSFQNFYISNLNQKSSWKVEAWANHISAHSQNYPFMTIK